MSGNSKILLYEYKFARFLRRHRYNISLSILWTASITGGASATFEVYQAVLNEQILTSATSRAFEFFCVSISVLLVCDMVYEWQNHESFIEQRMISLLHRYSVILSDNALTFNHQLIVTKLNEELKQLQATTFTLNKNTTEKTVNSLPDRLNEIIVDFVFYEAIQRIFIKMIVVKSLISEWHLDLHLILKMLEFTRGNDEQCSFQMFHSEGIISFSFNDSDTVAAMIQQIPITLKRKFSDVRMPEPNEICLKYHLKSKQFVDVQYSNNL